jgi:hypothetical protein
MIVTLTDNEFDSNAYWDKPLTNPSELVNADCVDLFDQNGYHLTNAEQAFARANNYPFVIRRHELTLRQDWIISDKNKSGVHMNHCDLFQRKGFTGDALAQLTIAAQDNPLLWKLIKMKPKWGIDISLDYVDQDGNVFEVFHYEWDSFEYDVVVEKKQEIQSFVLAQDWDNIAIDLIKRKDEWVHLDFFEQSKWKTDYYSLPEEKFKNVVWEN